jgi:ABC-2 type transport system permease protein
MNAVTSTLGKSSKPGAFTWLLKREFWENRGGFFWAPVITGGIFLVLNLILAVIGSISARGQLNGDGFSIEEAPEKAHQIVGGIGDGMLLGGVILACVVLAFVVFFYALGTLYDDRRDRSVLFWKSLPVSDTHMVLSKLAWALVLAPLLAVAVGIVIGVAMWLIFALTVSVNGLPVGSAVFTHSHPLRIIGGVISSLPVYMLWALPAVGWLMFCSAWSRSKPFLWAVLVPVLACVIISMTDILPGLQIRHDLIWYTVVYRGLASVIPGAWFPTLEGGATNPHANFNTPDDLANAIDLTRSWQAFATADLWIGAAIGVALIVGAIYLRRWRESE